MSRSGSKGGQGPRLSRKTSTTKKPKKDKAKGKKDA